MKTPKTEDDVRELDEQIQVENARVRQLKEELEEANSKNQDHTLDLYRQQAAMVSRKLTEQQFELEEHQAETEELKSAIEDKVGLHLRSLNHVLNCNGMGWVVDTLLLFFLGGFCAWLMLMSILPIN